MRSVRRLPAAAMACAAAVVLAGAPAEAQEGKQLTVAVYLPGLPIGSAEARNRFANDIAAAMQRSIGGKVVGRSYANLGDLEKELGETAFVVTDAAVAVTMKVRPIAIAQSGGGSSTQFALYALKDANVNQLDGKRLAHPKFGRAVGGIVDWLLFEGEVATSQIKKVPVPDVLSGVQMLKLDKADFLLGYSSSYDQLRAQAPELKLIFRSGRVPNMVLAVGGAPGAADLAGKAQAALASFSAPQADVAGFRGAAGGELDSLRRGLGARPKRTPLFAEPALPWRGGRVNIPPVPSPQPPVEGYVIAPTGQAPLIPR